MNLRELINRLEQLSDNGRNDYMPVRFKCGNDWQVYPEVVSAWISQDPTYNFDEANCGPDEWVELKIDNEEAELFGI